MKMRVKGRSRVFPMTFSAGFQPASVEHFLCNIQLKLSKCAFSVNCSDFLTCFDLVFFSHPISGFIISQRPQNSLSKSPFQHISSMFTPDLLYMVELLHKFSVKSHRNYDESYIDYGFVACEGPDGVYFAFRGHSY